MSFSEQTLCILGNGLLGASIGLAARKKKLAKRIVVWSRSAKTREETAQLPWCDEVFPSAAEAASQADLVVICTPVSTIVPLFIEIADGLSTETIVTDVGSTKNNILSDPRLLAHPRKSQFIGSHPMAGSDKTGHAHAQADLFVQRTCLLTPVAENTSADVTALQIFWEALGMNVLHLSPAEHDTTVAAVSHLPHAVAVTLCNQLGDHFKEKLQASGPGFRDSTRIAAGSPDIWSDIFLENKEAVLETIASFEKELHHLKTLIKNGDKSYLHKYLENAQEIRNYLE